MSNLKMTEPTIVFYIYDEFNKFIGTITFRKNASCELTDGKCELNKLDFPEKFAAAFRVDGYFFSVFTRLLNISSVYFRMVRSHFFNNVRHSRDDNKIIVKFQLVKPKIEVLDYAWNDRLSNLLVERQELEHAMSWLSTLGGAFSALGDNFENCAKVAGKISVQQFKIAFRLGEPLLVARCRLYMALSLIQLGKLKIAKRLIQEQNQLAKTFNDFRLQNMCKGVWAKLQYISKEKKSNYKKQIF